MNKMVRQVRRMLILVFGLTLLAIGIAMIVLPGPALVVIPLSLVVLGTEFIWARHLLKGLKKGTDRLKAEVKARGARFKKKKKDLKATPS